MHSKSNAWQIGGLSGRRQARIDTDRRPGNLDSLAFSFGWIVLDDGHGEDDAIALYAFRWGGITPDQAAFEALMREAVAEIDTWITRQKYKLNTSLAD